MGRELSSVLGRELPDGEEQTNTTTFTEESGRKALGFVKKAAFSQEPYRWLTVTAPDEPNGTELQLALNDNPPARASRRCFNRASPPSCSSPTT